MSWKSTMQLIGAQAERDQAIVERDEALRRLAEAEARIGRLREWIRVDCGYAPYTRDVLLPGDLAPDDADPRPGPSNPLVQMPNLMPFVRRDHPEGE